jgi:hypothetical protein
MQNLFYLVLIRVTTLNELQLTTNNKQHLSLEFHKKGRENG